MFWSRIEIVTFNEIRYRIKNLMLFSHVWFWSDLPTYIFWPQCRVKYEFPCSTGAIWLLQEWISYIPDLPQQSNLRHLQRFSTVDVHCAVHAWIQNSLNNLTSKLFEEHFNPDFVSEIRFLLHLKYFFIWYEANLLQYWLYSCSRTRQKDK